MLRQEMVRVKVNPCTGHVAHVVQKLCDILRAPIRCQGEVQACKELEWVSAVHDRSQRDRVASERCSKSRTTTPPTPRFPGILVSHRIRGKTYRRHCTKLHGVDAPAAGRLKLRYRN